MHQQAVCTLVVIKTVSLKVNFQVTSLKFVQLGYSPTKLTQSATIVNGTCNMHQAFVMAVRQVVISQRVSAMVSCAVSKTVLMGKSTLTSYVTVVVSAMAMSTAKTAQFKRLKYSTVNKPI